MTFNVVSPDVIEQLCDYLLNTDIYKILLLFILNPQLTMGIFVQFVIFLFVLYSCCYVSVKFIYSIYYLIINENTENDENDDQVN